MRERGKSVEAESSHFYCNYSSSSDLPCKKHPSSNSVGICAYCLKDRLIKLVCSDCGEQRLSSCSCSADDTTISSYSYRNSSCTTMDVGSVGRISFLIENEKSIETLIDLSHSNSKPKNTEKSEKVVLLKRSNSCCVEVEKSKYRFWKMGKFFRKTRNQKGCSRSLSLCTFRGAGGNFMNDPDEEGSDFGYSSAKISDVNEAEPRKSGLKGNGLLEVERTPNKSAFQQVKESDFSVADESGDFIDLKLDLSSESKTELSVLKKSDLSIYLGNGGCFESWRGDEGVFGNGGSSCRITVNERGIKKGGSKAKGHKVWKWIFKHHPIPGWR